MEVILRRSETPMLQFGFEMGTALRTYSPSRPPLACALLVAATGQLMGGRVSLIAAER